MGCTNTSNIIPTIRKNSIYRIPGIQPPALDIGRVTCANLMHEESRCPRQPTHRADNPPISKVTKGTLEPKWLEPTWLEPRLRPTRLMWVALYSPVVFWRVGRVVFFYCRVLACGSRCVQKCFSGVCTALCSTMAFGCLEIVPLSLTLLGNSST